MSLIDTTYFVRDINVPISATPALTTIFTNAILRYENEILKKLLGYTLWKEFTDAVDASEVEGADPLAQKWVDLKDGVDFSFDLDGHTINTHWDGLVNSDKISLIAYYVYYKHRINHESEYTGTGETVLKSENSKVVSPLNKLVRVHSEMLNLYGKIPIKAMMNYSFLDNANYVHYNSEPSAYNFILANKEDYPDWVFIPIGNVNSFGI
jgi:hypothetical protein